MALHLIESESFYMDYNLEYNYSWLSSSCHGFLAGRTAYVLLVLVGPPLVFSYLVLHKELSVKNLCKYNSRAEKQFINDCFKILESDQCSSKYVIFIAYKHTFVQ